MARGCSQACRAAFISMSLKPGLHIFLFRSGEGVAARVERGPELRTGIHLGPLVAFEV